MRPFTISLLASSIVKALGEFVAVGETSLAAGIGGSCRGVFAAAQYDWHAQQIGGENPVLGP